MNLYIETENGVAKNHPALEDNLIQAFGTVPPQWEPFTRVDVSTLGPYRVLESDAPSYEKVNGGWTDVWVSREMTAEEKAAKQQSTRDEFNARDQSENWSAWILDEATCVMVPPVPRPEADQTKLDAKIFTFWCGADANWKDSPVRPKGNYNFDFLAWQWVEVVN